MTRTLWMPAALALGAVLAAGQPVRADDTVRLGTTPGQPGVNGSTVTLGGTGTVTDAASAGDTELTHGRRYGYGYSYGYYGGGYYGGYQPYYGGYSGGYRPYYGGVSVTYYGGGYGYRPAPYYRGGYYGGYRPYYGGYHGHYYRYAADGEDIQAPTINLGSRPAAVVQPVQPRNASAPGTFNYDGGPAVPVPLPSTNPQPLPRLTPATNDIPVSLKPQTATPTTPYKFKAYGEK